MTALTFLQTMFVFCLSRAVDCVDFEEGFCRRSRGRRAGTVGACWVLYEPRPGGARAGPPVAALEARPR